MASTAAEIDAQLIAFVLPSIPQSVRMARFHVRATLGFHGLGEYADDAEIITSELVTNVIQHACGDSTETVGVTLARIWDPEAVAVVVSDSSLEGPAMHEASADGKRGRGLRIVEALSAQWGWHPEEGGKAIFAVLAKEAGAAQRSSASATYGWTTANPLDGLDAPCCRMSRLTLLSVMPHRSASLRFDVPAVKASTSRSASASRPASERAITDGAGDEVPISLPVRQLSAPGSLLPRSN
jgi:anti-sigma regulatory factor (Ser/Thr protein kinase)